MIWLWRELVHVTGMDDVSGPWYGFWSGFAGDIPLFGVFLVLWRRHNCHVSGCWRLQWRMSGEHALCRKHHPSAAPTAAEIAGADMRGDEYGLGATRGTTPARGGDDADTGTPPVEGR